VSADQGDDGLFEMTPVEPSVVVQGPVEKTFRPFQPDQILLVPPSLDEWLPQNHLARFIADLVDEPWTCRRFTPTTARVGERRRSTRD